MPEAAPRRMPYIAIHGWWGSGKTWFGASTPGPRLIIDAEDGALDIPGKSIEWDPNDPLPKGIKPGEDVTVVASITTWSQINQIRRILASGNHPFRSISIDSLTEIQKQLKDNLTGGDDDAQFDQQAWGRLLIKLENFVRELRNHTRANAVRPMAIVVITGSDDDVVPAKPMFQGGLRKTYPGFFDLVGYYTTRTNDDGDMDRVLNIHQTQTFVAKCRLHRLSVHCSPTGEMINPTVTDIIDIINQEDK